MTMKKKKTASKHVLRTSQTLETLRVSTRPDVLEHAIGLAYKKKTPITRSDVSTSQVWLKRPSQKLTAEDKKIRSK